MFEFSGILNMQIFKLINSSLTSSHEIDNYFIQELAKTKFVDRTYISMHKLIQMLLEGLQRKMVDVLDVVF